MTPSFSLGIFLSLLSGASHIASPQVWQRNLGIGNGINLSHAKGVYRVQWWLLLFYIYSSTLSASHWHALDIQAFHRQWLNLWQEEQGLSPQYISLDVSLYYTAVRAGGLFGVLQRTACANVILHCNEDLGHFFSSFSFALSSKKRTWCTVYQPLPSPQWNSTTPSNYHAVLRVLRSILCRNILQYFFLDINV